MANLIVTAGQTIRFPVDVAVLGIDVDPASLVLHMQDPNGNVTEYSSPTSGAPPTWAPATGAWYQDVDFASSATVGVWIYYWTSVGTQPNQYGVSDPVSFQMQSPGF